MHINIVSKSNCSVDANDGELERRAEFTWGSCPVVSSSACLAEVFAWFLSVISVQDKSLFWVQLMKTARVLAAPLIKGAVFVSGTEGVLGVCTRLLLALRLGSNDCVELNEEEMSWVAFVILLRMEKKYSPSLQIYFYGDLTRRVT